MSRDLLLAIDVGNTNTVAGVYRDTRPLGTWRVATNRERTGDEYAATLTQLMTLDAIDPKAVGAAVLASVVPQVVFPVRRMCRRYFGCEPRVVSADDLRVDIKVDLPNPKEVGADRLINAFAAYRRFRQALIVVDFGTATTFDVVDGEGAYKGGVIAPGINLSLEALHRVSAQLPRIAVDVPPRTIGTSTVTAMQSGIYWGYVGLIEGLIRRIKDEHGAPMRVVATGGLAEMFLGPVPSIEAIDPDLTMNGLVQLYRGNSAAYWDST